MSNDWLWVEKYRPKTVSDTILPPILKRGFQAIVDGGEVPNMLFTGTAGLGKTTVAKAICQELNLDYITINCSKDGNIDTIRNKLTQFASTVSMGGGYKVVILDEADGLNAQSSQPALRGFIEDYSANCRFILTCNFKNKLIEPLTSRNPVYEFNTTRKDMAQLCGQFLGRAKEILTAESIEYNEAVVARLIMKYAPDWRRVLGELQRAAVTGEVTENSVNDSAIKFSDLFAYLKDKDFKKMRTWVVNNIASDSTSIFRGIYDEMNGVVENKSIPVLVLILAEYQYKSAFVADHEINTVACMTEIMSQVEFQ